MCYYYFVYKKINYLLLKKYFPWLYFLIISKKAFDEYKNTTYEDIKEQKRVSNVIKKLLVSCPQKVSIKIYLLKDQSINANCLSDGSIFVTKGALNNLSNKK